MAGKGLDRTRHSAVTSSSEREKNSCGRGRITCPLLPARIQNRTRRKVSGNDVRSQCGKARVPGRPSTRPEQECVAVREPKRPLRRAASRVSRSRAPRPNGALPLARPGAAPPMGGRDFPPSVHGRNMAVPVPHADVRLPPPNTNTNIHYELCMTNKTPKFLLT